MNVTFSVFIFKWSSSSVNIKERFFFSWNMQKAAILDRALSNTIIADFLRRNNYLVRFSNSVIRYTCIFPSSGVAFLIVFNDQLSPPLDNENDQKLLNDIHKFYKLHKTCYVILEQQQDKLKDRHFEVELIHSLQRKYLCDRLQFIPVPNIKTVVQVNSLSIN